MKELYMIMEVSNGLFGEYPVVHHVFDTKEQIIDFFKGITRKEYYELPSIWCATIEKNGKIERQYRMNEEDVDNILIKANREDIIESRNGRELRLLCKFRSKLESQNRNFRGKRRLNK